MGIRGLVNVSNHFRSDLPIPNRNHQTLQMVGVSRLPYQTGALQKSVNIQPSSRTALIRFYFKQKKNLHLDHRLLELMS